MARSPSTSWHMCFHWWTVLAICAMSGHCSADCNDIDRKEFAFLESESVGYEIFNVTASSLKVASTDHNDLYRGWLNASEVTPGVWVLSLQKSFDADMSDAGTLNFKCEDSFPFVNVLYVTLLCQDATTTGDEDVSVILTIGDVNEYPPQFVQPDHTININETVLNGTIVYKVSACDPDSSPNELEYRIVDGDNGYFDIPGKYVGSVYLVKELDYDSGNKSFVLNISATELPNTGIGRTNYTTLTVNVIDEDDLMPEFINAPYTLVIPEGHYAGHEWFDTIPVLSARDGDHDINQTIRFRIGTGSPNSQLFSVAENGSIAAIGSLNYGTYNILVEAYQTDNQRLRYVTTSVTIAVTDINDHTPEMSETEYTANVSEALSPGTSILTVYADDKDEGNNSVIEFYLDQAGSSTFTVTTEGHMGVITLLHPLDRELRSKYTFQVWAEETLTTEHRVSNKSQVVITVLDENDNAPNFTKPNYAFNLKRTQHKGDPVGQVSASDPDAGVNGEITYKIQFSSSLPSAFTMDNSSGSITLTRDLELADVGIHHLTVSATDNAADPANRRSSFVQVTVNISSVNTKSPVFTNNTYTFYILENVAPGFLVGKVTATDDDGDQIQYSPPGNLSSYFNLDSISGEITVAKTPDLDNQALRAPSVVQLSVNASDGLHVTTTDVTIIVRNVNEFPPKCVSQGSVTVFENDTEGTFIVKVNATDADAGSDGVVTFSLLATATSDLFKVNASTGEVRLNCSNCLDPSRGHYDLIIQAKDGGSPPFTDTVAVRVEVNKTKFAPPKFTQTVYYVSVTENQSAQIVFQLSATDDDTPLSQLTFNLSQVDPRHLTRVFPNGSIYIPAGVDAEKINQFVAHVSVTDGHGIDYAQVVFNVTDENDNHPVLNITSLGPITIPENSTIADFVAAVGAQDDDVTNDGFSYFLSAGTDGKFVIDIKTGIVTTSGLLDRKLKSEYNITVNVLDHGLPPQLGSGNLIVRVTDSNRAPYFVNGSSPTSSYDFYVPENLNVGGLVGSLDARDPDSGSSGELSFKLQPGSSSRYFSLDKNSGNLTVAISLNYEDESEHNLTVIVSDHSYTPLSATAFVTVYVRNIEEAPQWPLPLSTVYVTQTSVCRNRQQQLQALSQEVTTVSTTGEGDVKYSLMNTTNEFSINTTSGQLKTTRTLNEGKQAVRLQSCNRNSNVCSDAVLTVVVQNMKTLAFCPTFYTVNVSETALVNFSFLDLNTSESDSVVSYTISTGNAESKFGIGVHDGKLYVAGTLDREKTPSYTLLVSAEDTSSGEHAEAQVIVSILDGANEAPQFSAAVYHGEVLETRDTGFLVVLPLTNIPLVVVATDKDENSHVTYRIDPASDTSRGSFIINSNGTITVVNEIDYETIPVNFNKTYAFTVEASDGVNSSSATVVVHVQDVNDNPPSFLDQADLVLNVTEGEPNSKSGQDLVTVNATDPDTHTTLTYSLHVVVPTGVSRVFRIDRSSGTITVLRDLDREETDEYILNVTASDGEFTIFKQVTVNVLDVNDCSPVFNQTFNMTVIEGDSGIGTNISVTAFDLDSGQNAEVTYTIVSGNVNRSFAFDDNVLKTVKALDKESIPYHNQAADIILTIRAVDKGQPPLSATGTVFVTVTGIDDNPPQFSQKRYTAEVPEDARNIALTLTPPMEITDADIGDCSGYLFSLLDNSSPFAVNESSGILFVQGSLDRESCENYTLQIVALGNCFQGLNTSAEIFIKILDVDDEPPRFSQSVYNFSISKNTQLRQSVGSVVAQDVDTSGDLVIYRLNGSDVFFIDPIQGEIELIGDLSRENTPVFYLTVSACDSGILSQCGTATVHISVSDMCPVWNITSLNLTAKEGETGPLGYISTLHGDLANVSYFLNDTDVALWLQISTSGEVILLFGLTANKADITSHVISVYAEVYSQPNCSLPGSLTITVLGTNDNYPEICYQGRCGDPEIKLSLYDWTPENSLVALVAARDNDTGPDGDCTLTLTTITTGLDDLFTLKDTEIILQKQLSLNNLTATSGIQNDTIYLTLTATDHGQPPLSINTSIRVKVFAISQSRTFSFTNQTYFWDVPENQQPKTVIGTVTAESSSSGAPLEYSLHVPVGTVPFGIDSITGTITTSAGLDRETEERYLFTVSATDSSQPQVSALALVVVIVADVNERPEFDNTSMTLYARENEAPVDLVTLNARDGDAGNNGSVSYVLASASSFSNFAVNKTTGVLSVTQALDRENTSRYDLVIQAVDGGSPPLSATVNVRVVVTDENDHAPRFTQSNHEYNLTTSEPPVKVATITATDDDEGANKDIVFSLQTDYNTFKIDPLSGEIESIASLRRNDYTLVVMAKDKGNPPLNSTVDVTVRLIDNRTIIVPSLSLSTNFLSLIAGVKIGTPLNVKITAKDADRLEITGGNGTTFFGLQNDKIVVSQDLTQESVFVLIITATSTTGHNVSTQLEIHVDSIKFSQQSYTAAVVENTMTSQTILDIDSNAEKLGLPVIYSLIASDSAFHIESTTGILLVQQPLDRELFPVYVLNVSLSLDPSVTSLHGRRKRAAFSSEAFVSVLVKVEDQNDNNPSFDNLGSELHLSVPGSVNASYLITTLKAYDPDEGMNGLIRYSISFGDTGVFDLNASNGELRVASPDKLRDHSTFVLTVEAADRNGTGYNISLNVWITVEQGDDLFRLSTPLSVSALNQHQEDILQSLSKILGLTLSNVRLTVHEESGNVDPGRSDILFQAYQDSFNTTTALTVSQIQAQVSNHQAEIQKLFKSFETQPQAEKKEDDMNATSIALIVVACVMFVATLIAIFVSYRMWKTQKKYEKKYAHKRSAEDNKPKEGPKEVDGDKKYTSLNTGEIEMTILFKESVPTSADSRDVPDPSDDQYLQQVQQSLQALASESVDSGIASSIRPHSEASGQDSPAVALNLVLNEDKTDASSSVVVDAVEKGDGLVEIQNEMDTHSKVQNHVFVNVAAEDGSDENRTELNELESVTSTITSTVLQEETSLTLPSQDSLSDVISSEPPFSPSRDALPQNSNPDYLKNHLHKSYNHTPYHPTANGTAGLSFLNTAFDNSDHADVNSDTEAITHF